jgi:hypothetical protein
LPFRDRIPAHQPAALLDDPADCGLRDLKIKDETRIGFEFTSFSLWSETLGQRKSE